MECEGSTSAGHLSPAIFYASKNMSFLQEKLKTVKFIMFLEKTCKNSIPAKSSVIKIPVYSKKIFKNQVCTVDSISEPLLYIGE